MAEKNEGGAKPTSTGVIIGPGEHLVDTAPQTADTSSITSSSMGTANLTAESGGTRGMNTGDMAAKASDTIKQTGARITDDAKQYASDMAKLAKEKSRSAFQQQKDAALVQVDSVAQALRSTADRLQGEGQAAGRYISLAADQLESLGQRLQQKDLDTLIEDTQNLARRSPGTFFAGTVVAGFLLARFMKSSSERRRESMERSDEEGRTSSVPRTGNVAAPSHVHGAAETGMSGAMGTSGDPTETLPGSATGALGADGTPSSADGTTSVGTSSSTLTGSAPGGNSYGNR